MPKSTPSTGVPEAAVEAVLARRAAEGAEVEDTGGRKAIWTVLRPTVEADLRAAYPAILADFKERLLSKEAREAAARSAVDELTDMNLADVPKHDREVAERVSRKLAPLFLEAAFNKATEDHQ